MSRRGQSSPVVLSNEEMGQRSQQFQICAAHRRARSLVVRFAKTITIILGIKLLFNNQ